MYPSVPLPARRINPFAPSLRSAPVLVTKEQVDAMQMVLLLTSSDSKSAQKAGEALRIILAGGINSGVIPVLASLVPNTGVVGSPVSTVKVIGTGFDVTCQVHVNGNQVTTMFVSPTELRFDLDLSGVTEASTLTVVVRTSSSELSNSLPFTVTL